MRNSKSLFPRFSACSRLLSVGEHPQESCTLNGGSQHFLVLETCAGVVALADVPKVIRIRLEQGVIFIVDVEGILLAEGALLATRIGTLLVRALAHGRRG